VSRSEAVAACMSCGVAMPVSIFSTYRRSDGPSTCNLCAQRGVMAGSQRTGESAAPPGERAG